MSLLLMLVLLQRVCTHEILGILETSLCVHFCVVVERMHTYKIWHFCKKAFVLMFVFCKENVHM